MGDDDERDQRRQVHHRRGAQHAALAVAVHQPPLGDRPERVGDAEGADHVARLGERAGGLARQQQDREAEHADRHRAGDRQQHRRTGARQIQDLPVPLPAPRMRSDASDRGRRMAVAAGTRRDEDVTTSLRNAYQRGEVAPGGGRHVLVAAMPKSGSSLLIRLVAELPGFQRIAVVRGHDRRENELALDPLVRAHGRDWVAQAHVRHSTATARMVRTFSCARWCRRATSRT